MKKLKYTFYLKTVRTIKCIIFLFFYPAYNQVFPKSSKLVFTWKYIMRVKLKISKLSL